MNKVGLVFLFVIGYITVIGQGRFEVTKEIRSAYEEVISLRFDDAKKTIASIKLNDPDNVLVYHIENYIDFFTIFINEEEAEYDELVKNKDIRLEKLAKGDRNSPYYKFSQAEVILQWIVAQSKFKLGIKDRLSIASDANFAYRLLEQNELEFPDFIGNKKSLSVIHALANYMPSVLKKILKVRGSLTLGKMEIEQVILEAERGDFLFKNEAYAIYAYMLTHLFNQSNDAYEVLLESELDHKENPLAGFLLSTIALKSGKSEIALDVLQHTPRGTDGYYPFYYLDYLEGKCRLYQLQPEANEYIISYIENFSGRHFIKDAYQKLAWYELCINNDLPAYKYAMSQCQKKGEDYLEDDQQALREAKQKKIPNTELLQARLLYDGGYYQKAKDNLIQKAYLFPEGSIYIEEYNYRMGRISQASKNYYDAIDYYTSTLKTGQNSNSFFACNAALQLGLIYEEQGFIKDAIYYFKECKNIDPDVYQGQLHKKADTGLERLKKK